MKLIILVSLLGVSLGAPQAPDNQFPEPRRVNNPPPQPFRDQPKPFRDQSQSIRTNQGSGTRTEPYQTIRSHNVNNGDGSYSHGYETENGITVEETGSLRARAANEDPIQTVKGFFQYFAPDGDKYRVDYTGDEHGFNAQGDHLPTPPPIPDAIMKSLAIIYANAEKQKQTERTAEQNRNRF